MSDPDPRGDVRLLDPVRSVFKRFQDLVRAVLAHAAQMRLPQTAASLAFLSLLALVPVFTIAVSLLGALPMFARLRDALLKFLAANLFLPSFSETVVRYLNQFAAKASQLSAIGALVFFASAFSALITIDGTLNRIWRVERRRPLARRLTIYWTFLTLGPLLLGGSVAINGLVATELFGGANFRLVERVWLGVLPWVITLGGLTLLYRLVPNAPVRWLDALAGATVATLLLEVLKVLLAMQVARLPTYTIVYGAFAALPMFLVWLFLVWSMVLAGALVAASLPDWRDGVHARRAASAAARFDAAAQVLGALVGARGGTLCARALRDVFESDAQAAAAVARMLCDLGYLVRLWRIDDATVADAERAVWDEHWALADDAAAMTLRPLFEHVWRDGRGAPGETADLAAIDCPLRGTR